MWNSAMELFRDYMGTGWIVGFFMVAVVYLFFTETDKAKRLLFIYIPVVLLLIYFNPLFCKLLYTVIGDEIYYRILWLIPVTMVLAYGITVFYQRIRGWRGKGFLLLAGVLVMTSGSLIYKNVNFKKAENLNHIPQTVVDICDAIQVEGREVMAVFPMEMVQYVRQYSAYVCMPYGRELIVDTWGYFSMLKQVMTAEKLIVEQMAPLAKEDSCHYIIVASEKEIVGDMAEYDYELFDSIDGYDIYIDRSVYIGVYDE